MYLSYIHFSPLHSPASPQHHLSPWKPLQNDSYLSKWPNLALFSSPFMIFPFESLPSLDFMAWWHCHLCGYSLSISLSAAIPFFLPLFPIFWNPLRFCTHQVVVSVHGRFETLLSINGMQGSAFCSPVHLFWFASSTTFLRSQFASSFIWGAQIRWH